MEVDEAQQRDGSNSLEELSEIMVELEDRPGNVSLLRRQVRLLRSLPMTDEYLEAVETLQSLVMIDVCEFEPLVGASDATVDRVSAVWIDYFDKLLKQVTATLDTFLQIVERFTRAENDYLCQLNGRYQ